MRSAADDDFIGCSLTAPVGLQHAEIYDPMQVQRRAKSYTLRLTEVATGPQNRAFRASPRTLVAVQAVFGQQKIGKIRS